MFITRWLLCRYVILSTMFRRRVPDLFYSILLSLLMHTDPVDGKNENK